MKLTVEAECLMVEERNSVVFPMCIHCISHHCDSLGTIRRVVLHETLKQESWSIPKEEGIGEREGTECREGRRKDDDTGHTGCSHYQMVCDAHRCLTVPTASRVPRMGAIFSGSVEPQGMAMIMCYSNRVPSQVLLIILGKERPPKECLVSPLNWFGNGLGWWHQLATGEIHVPTAGKNK